jgi:hypothetical protein
MTGNAIEIAELTIGNTDISGIEVAVYDPGNLLGIGFLEAQDVGCLRQCCQGGMFKKINAFIRTEEFSVQ